VVPKSEACNAAVTVCILSERNISRPLSELSLGIHKFGVDAEYPVLEKVSKHSFLQVAWLVHVVALGGGARRHVAVQIILVSQKLCPNTIVVPLALSANCAPSQEYLSF
jgi:hypothetical protein